MTERTPQARRRRAPGMSPEQRRDMIVRTALPLVAEHGAAVTTSQVARAAGIGEATIFRAFTDKDDLLRACVAETLRADTVVDALAEIPIDQPLDARLVEASQAMRAYLERMGTVMGALHASGFGRHHGRTGASTDGDGPAEPRHAGPPERNGAVTRITEALAGVIRPDQDSLRLPADRLAATFASLLLAHSRLPTGDGPAVAAEELVDVFLHGALAREGGDR